MFGHLRIFGDFGQHAGYQLAALLTIMLTDLFEEFVDPDHVKSLIEAT